MQSKPYAQVVGNLMYVKLCTHPYLDFAVSLVSRYQSNPRIQYQSMAKCILRYVLGFKDLKVMFQANELVPIGSTNSDYVGDRMIENQPWGMFLFLVVVQQLRLVGHKNVFLDLQWRLSLWLLVQLPQRLRGSNVFLQI